MTRTARFTIIVATAAVVLASCCAFAAPNPIWVHQPAYDGMSFYVYQPANINKGWYVTYDGYPVIKTWNGVWVYGTRTGDTLTPTNYVVGSVVPSVVGIVPWVQEARIATGTPGTAVQPVPYTPQMLSPQEVAGRTVVVAAPTVPVAPVAPVAAEVYVSGQVAATYMPPSPNGEVSQVPVLTPTVPVVQGQVPVSYAYVPVWMTDPTFMSVANWKIDRVGVLNNPSIPVAWKGHNPDVIYAWTGRTWQQIDAQNKTPIGAIRSAIYALVRRSNHEHLNWGGADTATLASCAATWGCRWLGEIIVNENY